MKKLIEALKKHYHIIVFDVFFIIIAYAMMAVPLAGDDFVYGSFVGGLSRFISENLHVYMTSDGHIAANMLSGILARLPITVWRLIELAVIGATVWLTADIAAGKKREKFPIALTLSCVGFASLDLVILRETVLWLSGSVRFVFPLFFVLLLFRLLSSAAENGRGAWYLPVIALAASVWSEQTSLAALLICIFILIRTAVSREKAKITHMLTVPAALLGLALLLLSPGSAAVRSSHTDFYGLGLFDRIRTNASYLFDIVFGTTGMIVFFTAFFAIAGFAAIRRIIATKKGEASLLRLILDTLLIVFPLMTAIVIILRSPFVPFLYVRAGLILFLVISSSLLIAVDMAISFFRGSDVVSLPFTFCAGVLFLALFTGINTTGRFLFAPIVFLIIPTIRLAFTAFELRSARIIMPLLLSLYAANIVTTTHTLAIVVIIYAIFLFSFVTPAKNLNGFAAVCAALAMLGTVAYGYNLNRGVTYCNNLAVEAIVSGEDTDGVLTFGNPEAPGFEHCPIRYSGYYQSAFKNFYGIGEDVVIEFVPAEKVTGIFAE